jgi:hypothetical protein
MTASRPQPRAPRSTFPTRAPCLLALLVLAGITPGASADVYKWVDASGQVHYSDTPPAGIRYEVIRTPAAAPAPPPEPSAAPSPGTAPAATAPAQAEPKGADATAAATADDQACVDALYQVELLSQKRRAYRPGPGGTRTYIEDAARPAELERLQRQRDANCSDDPETRKSQERRAAELAVTLSPDCQGARGKLELMLDPATRTDESDIERQREYLRTHCPGEDRADLWMADWMHAHWRR